MASYIAVLHKEQGSDYGVCFPDFPGCVTAGSSIDEAREMAAEALALHVEGMTLDGERVPAPMSLEEAREHEFAEGAAAFFIVDVPGARYVRVTITVPEDDLRAIDRYAKARGQARSAFLVSSAKAVMRMAREEQA